MNNYADVGKALTSPRVLEKLSELYGTRDGMTVYQSNRYNGLLKRHEELFNSPDRVQFISAPGRTEIGGNHTDHNRGRVLAASVNLDCLSAVTPRNDMLVNLVSEGYAPIQVDLSDLALVEEEKGTTRALIRGVAARMVELGYKIGGFDVAVTSSVASGSGLSSSAAFEVMVCAIFDQLYNGFVIDFKTRAKIGQYAENVYFGKPSGLLDQMASAAGGLVAVDFKEDDPEVFPLSFDFAAHGYSLVVVATGGSHADLTDDYAAIPNEMKAVAGKLGAPYLRKVRREEFIKAIPELRNSVSDRAIMRAMHFYDENQRVTRQVEALRDNELTKFFDNIIESGRSSYMYLQNVYAKPEDQSLSLALCMAESMLKDRGAWRIHGGGFAGTTLNFVPQDLLAEFIAWNEQVFGKHCCHVLDIRPQGAAVIEL
ncbi:MAG: galactokinase family protein [Clostridia bacterium]|nr:galactokinase family protein [Clostridia bacterium]